MPFTLDLKYEALNYTGYYARPALELWGNGGEIIKGLLEALQPHGVKFPQIQLTGTATDTGVVANIPNVGSVKFAFDKLEFKFANFSQEFFDSIPTTMEAVLMWIRKCIPDFEFASHHITYFCHSFVKDATPQDVLKSLNVRELKSAGISLGNGAIFNYAVPSKSWETQLLIDKSKHLTGGLFINLEMLLHTGKIDFGLLISEGRDYLGKTLAELDLMMPEVGPSKGGS